MLVLILALHVLLALGQHLPGVHPGPALTA
jgi:hypothetical protein